MVNPVRTLTRRDLFRRLGLGLGGLAILQLAWIVGDLLAPRRKRARTNRQTAVFTAGPVDGFARGSVTAFPQGRFYLVRLTDGGFLALDRACTHLGCTVPWLEGEQRFACPCHASAFDITGEVLGPPATRPLDLLPVRIENQTVKVELGRTIRRTRFEPAQVALP
jgi:cytochrome b6-f complex iron-sulfur subunit